MARILDVFLKKSTNVACNRYPDTASLVAALKQEEADAIRCLSSKISGYVYQIAKNARLPDEDIEELHCDCIMIFIDKIRTGKYEYAGFDPATYVIEIARRRVFHYSRKLAKGRSSELDSIPEPTAESEWDILDQTEILRRNLAKIGEKCRQLITLRYLDSLKDKEVIERKLTSYSTVDALKTHRAQCLKKLTEMVARFRESA
jgi:RNA polymerase sigma factor (sigma-70 family)